MKKTISNFLKSFLIVLLSVFSLTNFSQGVIPTVGTDFWLTYTENFSGNPLMELFVTSDVNTSGTVELPLLGWTENFTVIANETTTITLPATAGNSGSNIYGDNGVHLISDDDVSLFAINFIGFTSDASKILPKVSIGTEYMVMSYAGISGNFSEIAIVATEDDTEIEITPSANIAGGVNAGTTYTILLNAGETYQIQTTTGDDDFTGTYINATEESGDCRPFAVFSGSECANIPIGCTFCDMVFDQNFPIDSWGSEYLIPPFDFSSSYTYKVLAIEDNTDVFIDGAYSFTLNAGEHEEFNMIEDPQYVSASAPVNVTQFMQGVSCSVIGDPAMLVLNAVDQQIEHVTFSTVTSTVITQHVVNIVTESNFTNQVFLDEVPIDPSEFSTFPGLPSFSYARIPLTEGSHTLDSPEGFSAYVYGIGDAESYAYSVGSFSFEEPISIYSVDCSGNEVALSPDVPMYNIWWSTEEEPEISIQDGGDLILVPPIETQVYILHGLSNFSDCPLEFTYSVESPEEIGVNIIPDSLELCFHESYTFQPVMDPPSPNYVYSWSAAYAFEDPTVSNAVIQPEVSGWYYLEVTTISECGFGEDSVYVEVIGGAIADFAVSATNEALCLPDSTILNVDIQEVVLLDNFDTGIDFPLWETIDGGIESDICGSLSEGALYFNQASPRQAETIDIDVSEGGVINFAIKVANGVAPCDDAELGEDIYLEYSTNGGGAWTDIIILYEMLYPDFTVMSVDIPAGAQTAATRFRWRQDSSSGVDEDNWSLDNISISTTMSSAANIEWSSEFDQNIQDPTLVSTPAFPILSGQFYCDMTFDGCSYVDSVYVIASTGVDANLNDTTICITSGAVVQYQIDDPSLYSFNWFNNPALDNSVIAFPTIVEDEFEGMLQVLITNDLTQCVLMDTMNVSFGELQINYLEDETICIGTSLDYEYDDQNLVFTWTDDVTLSETSDTTLVLEPTETTTYFYEVTDGQDCFLNSEIIITVSNPEFELGDSETLCPGEEIEFDFPEFDTFMIWNGTENTSTYTISSEGTYIASVVNEFNCEFTDEITVNYFPVLDVLGDDLIGCPEDDLVYNAMPGLASYLWSTGSFEPFIEPIVSDEYTIIVEDNNGCFFQDTIQVEIVPSPTLEFSGIPLICENGSTVLTAVSDANQFEWSNSTFDSNVSLSQPGEYSVIVTSDDGCINSGSILVDQFFFGDLGLPIDTFYCHGTSVELSPNYNPVVDYFYQADPLFGVLEVFQPGIHTITGIYEVCEQTTFVNVSDELLPVIDYAGNDNFCSLSSPEETSIVVFSDNNDDLLYFGEVLIDGPVHVNVEGNYIVNAYDSFGCHSEIVIPVTEICEPMVYIPNSFTPNQDGINEVFRVTALFIESYDIVIYNRWGVQIYHSTDVNDPWLGNVNGGTHYAQNDTYHYLITVKGIDNNDYRYNGSIHILR